MKTKKIVYYNMPSGIDYETELIKEWNISNIEIVNKQGRDVVADLQGYQGLVTEYTDMPKEVLKKLPELQIIALQSIGYDEIDVKAARDLKIDVTNAPGYCAEDVATHAMALLLGVVRQITTFHADVQKGNWNCFAGMAMHRLSGKTAGLISFGNIPQKLTPMLQGFGVNVVSFDPGRDENFMKQRGVKKCENIEMLLEQSDYVFLHTPLFDSTFHMINKDTIQKMKNGAILINVSRGALIDEEALIDALKNKKLAGAGLDVLENEKERNSELINFNNVIITPHAAFLSEDSLKQSRRMALEQLVQKLIREEVPTCLVN